MSPKCNCAMCGWTRTPPQCEMSVAIEITGAPLGELGLEQAGGVYFGTVDVVVRWIDDETVQFVERGG